ncbi:hypothetical protein GN956_G5672 [Arapaima gigas]
MWAARRRPSSSSSSSSGGRAKRSRAEQQEAAGAQLSEDGRARRAAVTGLRSALFSHRLPFQRFLERPRPREHLRNSLWKMARRSRAGVKL